MRLKNNYCPKLILLLVFLAISSPGIADEIRFSRDVLPILSDRCFHCHGPDDAHREADLRLDQRASATADRGGYAAITPGNAQASELLARITSDDPDTRMPPPASHRKKLTPAEIAILKNWINAGAVWGKHWAFEKPQRPKPPIQDMHPVDAFVLHRLRIEGIENLSPPAAKLTLLRRMSFDVIGLPPTPAEVLRFLVDDSPRAVENALDRLLASPHHGERMAMWWLDAARYSDTDGYQQDATRANWAWRDWVVESFNQNRAFDEFTRLQFAGDLLPDATPEQILATCFHRNHMTNGEGGRDPEESRIDYVRDRVNTTGTVWLGLTLECCQCHSHKFDPITHKGYYGLSAFFNSIDEDGKAGTAAKPYLKYQSPHAERAVQEAQEVVKVRKPVEAAARKQAEVEFAPWLESQWKGVRDGFQPWHVLRANSLEGVEGTLLDQDAKGTIQASGPNPRQDDYRIIAGANLKRITGWKLEVFPHASHTEGKLSRGKSGEFILTDVKLQLRKRGSSQLRDIEMSSAIADAEKTAKGREYGLVKDTLDDDPRNGWTTEGRDATKPHTAVYALAEPLELAEDEELIFVLLQRSTRGDANIGRFRLSVTDQPGNAVRSLNPMPLEELAEANAGEVTEIDAKLRGRLLDQFLVDHADYQQAKTALDLANRQLADVKKSAGSLSVMVLADRKEPRPSHVLVRGVWDDKGEVVSPSVPESVLPWPAEKLKNRLDLAQWIVSRENPLTARVVVNQLWQMYFGAGLVRTPEDFGLQGERPTHPDLLDWLAVELMEHDWDLRHIIRLIVTCRTYQQQSRISPELLERDPENRLLARASRFRLPSWMIRDAALRSSGLLNPAVGGPPVMPYQPPGVWEEIFMGRFQYQPSQGPAQYRRTLYAFWRRSSSPAFLFDSAQRRVCEVRPRRTNTPLHALTMLNDTTTLEASRELARKLLEKPGTNEERFKDVYHKILSRSPKEDELKVLSRELERSLQHYQQHPADAESLLAVGQASMIKLNNKTNLAAWMVLASLVYNLDEAITHE
jgi:hypothetical protein